MKDKSEDGNLKLQTQIASLKRNQEELKEETNKLRAILLNNLERMNRNDAQMQKMSKKYQDQFISMASVLHMQNQVHPGYSGV